MLGNLRLKPDRPGSSGLASCNIERDGDLLHNREETGYQGGRAGRDDDPVAEPAAGATAGGLLPHCGPPRCSLT